MPPTRSSEADRIQKSHAARARIRADRMRLAAVLRLLNADYANLDDNEIIRRHAEQLEAELRRRPEQPDLGGTAA